MSEPYSAFLELEIARADLVRWLDAPMADPARWTDWRDIGGQWYLGDGPKPLAVASAAELAGCVADARAQLSRYPRVRDGLRGLLRNSDAYNAVHIAYDPGPGAFIAGTLFYDEGLVPFIAFLAMVRGVEESLGPGGSGVALVHDDTFAPDDDEATVAALALGPGRTSRLLAGSEAKSAVQVGISVEKDPG